MANFVNPTGAPIYPVTGSLQRDRDSTTGIGGTLFTERRQFYPDPYTYSELWTSVTPFISNLINMGNKKTLQDPNFKLFEHRNPWAKMEATVKYLAASGVTTETSAITTTAGSTATIIVSDVVGLSGQGSAAAGAASTTDDSWKGQVFEVWDATKTTKRGNLYVRSQASNVLTVVNMGTASITSWIAGDILVGLNTLHGEGQVAPEAWGDEMRIVFGQTGIVRTAVEVTGTLYQASLRGANKELERFRKQKMELHKKKEELMLLRGVNGIGTGLDPDGSETFKDSVLLDSDGKVVRSPYGVISALEKYGKGSAGTAGSFGSGVGSYEYQNLFDFSGGLSYSQFVDAMEKIQQYLPESGIVDFYSGPTALSYWSKMDKLGSLKTGFPIRLSDMKTDTLGFFFKYLETPFGLARLIYTPSLKREYRNAMIKVTPENLFMAEYRQLGYFTNIKTDNHYDGVKDEYMSDIGVGMSLIESHAFIKTPLA